MRSTHAGASCERGSRHRLFHNGHFRCACALAISAAFVLLLLFAVAIPYLHENAGHPALLENADGSFVDAEESARIVEADSAYPLGECLKVYDSYGVRIALDDVDPAEYSGFIALPCDKNSASEKIADASTNRDASGACKIVGDGIVRAPSLEELDSIFEPSEIASIEPNYIVRIAGKDSDSATNDEAAADNAQDSGNTATAPDNDVPVVRRPAFSPTDDVPGQNSGSNYHGIASVQGVDISAFSTDDTYSSEQTDLATINVQGAWSLGVDGAPKSGREKVVVGVVDTGLMGTGVGDIQHEDLDYTHVLSGVNCVTGSAASGGTPDSDGHGTFCAGEIMATRNNRKGVAGIAPEAYVRPYKVFDGATGTVSAIIDAVDAAVKHGDVDVLSMSLSWSGYNDIIESVFEEAAEAGILLVAAASNDATDAPYYPAAFECVVGVSATTKDGDFDPSYSNYGKDNVYVSAPGSSIVGLGIKGSNSYAYLSGTSMACPEVAALAALVKSVVPDIKAEDFKALLRETSKDKGRPGYDSCYGWGLIDCGAAISSLFVPDDVAAKGTCGGVSWYVTSASDENPHQLVIKPIRAAAGVLDIPENESAPWSGMAETIQSVRIARGVQSGPNMAGAFEGFSRATDFDLENLQVQEGCTLDGMFEGASCMETLRVGSGWREGALFPSGARQCLTGWTSCASATSSEGTLFTPGAAIPGGEAVYSASWGHSESISLEPVEPTCTSDGKCGVSFCAVCKESMQDGANRPALGHDWRQVSYSHADQHGFAIVNEECARCRETRNGATMMPEDDDVYASGTLPGGQVGWYATDFDAPHPLQLVIYPLNGVSGTINNRDESWPWEGFAAAIKEVYICEGVSAKNSLAYMFEWMGNAKKIDASHLETAAATDMASMFLGCSSLETLDLSNFETSKVTDMCSMFYGCESLQHLDVSSFDTAAVTDMSEMFKACRMLNDLDVSSFNTAGVFWMYDMFHDCVCLQALKIPDFDTSEVVSCASMLENCTSLKRIEVGSAWTLDVAFPKLEGCICPYGASGIWRNQSSGTIYAEGSRIPSGAPGIYVANLTHGGASLCKVEAKPSTCDESGIKEHYECPFCGCVYWDPDGKNQVDPIDVITSASGHTWVSSGCISPTCTDAGTQPGKTCSRCGEVSGLGAIPALGHFEIACEAKEPTCTEPGMSAGLRCDRCSAVLNGMSEIPALGHDMYELSARLEPTCITAGHEASLKCSRCDKVETGEELPALGHNYESTVIAPGCESGGRTDHVCSRCKNTYSDEETAPTGHDMRMQSPAEEPTCTEDGREAVQKCSKCEKTDGGGKIAALGHNEVTDAGKEPSCTEDGLSAGVHCSRCGEILSGPILIPALGHKEKFEVAVEPTCTAPGWSAKSSCERCGISLDAGKEISPLGHDMQIVDEGESATCTEPGREALRSCSRCDASEGGLQTPALGHMGGAAVLENVVAADCINAGSQESVVNCVRCSVELSRTPEEIPALGHDEVVDAAVPATCTESGTSSGSHCARCSAVLGGPEIIPPLGHDVVSEVGNAPTCTEPGRTGKSSCTRCGLVLGEGAEIPALGHDMRQTSQGSAASCTSAGRQPRYECDRCGVISGGAAIPAFGHAYALTSSTAPTCTSAGSASYTCTRCSSSYSGVSGSALGHDWGDPSWEWAQDMASASAKLLCMRDKTHELNLRAVVTPEDADGGVRYRAVARDGAMVYTDDAFVPSPPQQPEQQPHENDGQDKPQASNPSPAEGMQQGIQNSSAGNERAKSNAAHSSRRGSDKNDQSESAPSVDETQGDTESADQPSEDANDAYEESSHLYADDSIDGETNEGSLTKAEPSGFRLYDIVVAWVAIMGIVAVLTGLGFGVYFLIKRRK